MHTTSYITEYIGGTLHGESDLEIVGVCSLNNSKVGYITFYNNSSNLKDLISSKASVIIIDKKISIPNNSTTFIRVDNPAKGIMDVIKLFNPNYKSIKSINNKYIIGENTSIAENVVIADNTVISDNVIIEDGVQIGPSCFIGNNSIIKSNTRIDSNVSIYHDVEIGQDVHISSGVRIGSQGFGIIEDKETNKVDFPHIGKVVIFDQVSIGSNTCIDRGTIDDTIIGRNTKIDNLVQIAHNVNIGENCIIAAQSGIAGSTILGDNVVLAGQVGVVGHISIADNVVIGSKSAVMQSINNSGTYSGIPAIEHRLNKKINVIMKKLPELYNKIKKNP